MTLLFPLDEIIFTKVFRTRDIQERRHLLVKRYIKVTIKDVLVTAEDLKSWEI